MTFEEAKRRLTDDSHRLHFLVNGQDPDLFLALVDEIERLRDTVRTQGLNLSALRDMVSEGR